MIVVAYDHRAYEFMQSIKAYVKSKGYIVTDVSNANLDPLDSYADIVAKADNLMNANNIGIFACGSGFGMTIGANRKRGMRAVLCRSEEDAKLARAHNNANVLVLSSDFTSVGDAKKIIDTFFATEFEGGRHLERIQMLDKI